MTTHLFTTWFAKCFFFFCLCFRERGREEERGGKSINVWEKLRSVASCTPPTGDWTATQACALTRNWTCDLPVCKTTPTQPSHSGQGNLLNVLSPLLRPTGQGKKKDFFQNITSHWQCTCSLKSSDGDVQRDEWFIPANTISLLQLMDPGLVLMQIENLLERIHHSRWL